MTLTIVCIVEVKKHIFHEHVILMHQILILHEMQIVQDIKLIIQMKIGYHDLKMMVVGEQQIIEVYLLLNIVVVVDR